ncbi:MAG TPA: phosphoribosylanthranilate isomerase [Methanobacterium sp.]|jgi:phosphoribosylanthranilate isomerase|nr:phosphoribosylanthranilate isomerase [Methanobacterium sp.]HOI39253.1 phosphoribosylanthranilate isomerase [Methanobacterium sp.]
MRIKICGIRSKEDLKICEEKGADLMGFINIERSKRMVEIEEIKTLLSFMKDKTKAVLVIEPLNMADAEEKIKKSGITNIQLHSLSSEEINQLKEKYQKNEDKTQKSPELTITRAIGISEVINGHKKREIEYFADVCDFLLFDYEIQGKTGGTGKQIPTETAIEAAEIGKTRNKNVKLTLAGGMNASRIKNEGKILKKFFNVFDINSGVEDKPGVKNNSKITELMKIKVE